MIRAALLLLPLFFVVAADAQDKRLGKPKTLNDYFPFTPPATKEAWEKRRQEVREQVLVANGLWPMPAKTPLNPTIHGKVERDGYTVEKVFFASHPGHYVCGNLYRPVTNRDRKFAGVLCPHGHWPNGRFYDATDWKNQMEIGAEKTEAGAKYPLQARCAQLARMGCVVFHYDMVGYADSRQINHSAGFVDPEAELRLQNFMGLQTWNSIRALDFLISLPEVDAARIGVTGASGGGTQTFILCGIDDRPTAAFPAVMVSTAMQGGCVCENASYLRVGTGNIELAGLFAPKPLGMAAADDWTIDIEAKGLPELKQLYKMLGAEDKVMAKCFKQFKHNYNQVSRELMYNFFNEHLKLGQQGPIQEQPFTPIPPKELSVFNDEHKLPKDAVDSIQLRNYLARESDKQLEALLPKDEKSLAEFRKVIAPALRAMVTETLPISATRAPRGNMSGAHLGNDVGTVVIVVHPQGAAKLLAGIPPPRFDALKDAILAKKSRILAVNLLDTTNQLPVDKRFPGYTFGYNRPLVAERVRDILSAVAFVKGQPETKQVHLLGLDGAGPWVALARGLCGDAVARTACDLNGFRFEQILSMQDEMMLPGALKYGGLLTLAGLCAPNELYLHNMKGTGDPRFLEAAYRASAKSDRQSGLTLRDDKATDEQVIAWLLR